LKGATSGTGETGETGGKGETSGTRETGETCEKSGTCEAVSRLKAEVFGASNPELRSSSRAFLACLAFHAPRSVALADFFSSLLVEEGRRL
jgi:hypothetical protein